MWLSRAGQASFWTCPKSTSQTDTPMNLFLFHLTQTDGKSFLRAQVGGTELGLNLIIVGHHHFQLPELSIHAFIGFMSPWLKAVFNFGAIPSFFFFSLVSSLFACHCSGLPLFFEGWPGHKHTVSCNTYILKPCTIFTFRVDP